MNNTDLVYHIIIFWGANSFDAKGFGKFDMTREELYDYYVTPYINNRPFFLDGKKVNSTSVDQFNVFRSPPQGSRAVFPVKSNYVGEDDFDKWSGVKKTFLTHYEDVTNGILNSSNSTTSPNLDKQSITKHRTDDMNGRRVFVVHGRMIGVRNAMFKFLESVGLKPMSWEKIVGHTESASPSNLQAVLAGAKRADAFVILITPEDLGRLHPSMTSDNSPDHEKQTTPQPRLNVVFEAGIAMALLPEKTVVVEFGKNRPFSDLSVNTIRITKDNELSMREAILDRLEKRGLVVSKDSGNWQTAGDFPFDQIDSLSQISDVSDGKASSNMAWVRQFEKLLQEIGNVDYVENHHIARYEELLRKSGLYEADISELNLCSTDYVLTTVLEPIFNEVIGGVEGHKEVPGPRRVEVQNLRFRIENAMMYLRGEIEV